MSVFAEAAAVATSPDQRSYLLWRHDLETLSTSIRSCTACDLSRTRSKAVPPDMSTQVPLAVVGEAPGAQEDRVGVPFVGRSGRALDDYLAVTGLDRTQVATFNTICCRPPGNDYQRAVDVSAPILCRPFFERSLDLSGAWMVVTLGAKALQSLTESRQAITQARGRPRWLPSGHLLVPTYHPAYALRKPEAAGKIAADFALVGDLLWDRLPLPKLKEIPVPVLRALSHRPMSRTDVESTNAYFRKNGFAWVNSRVGRVMVSVRSAPNVGQVHSVDLLDLVKLRSLLRPGREEALTAALELVKEESAHVVH